MSQIESFMGVLLKEIDISFILKTLGEKMRRCSMFSLVLAFAALLSTAFINCSQNPFTVLEPVGNGLNLSSTFNALSSDTSFLLPDPGLLNPKIRIHAGGVANNAPLILDDSLDISGFENSQWYLVQWKKQSYILPSSRSLVAKSDPFLGASFFRLTSASQESDVTAFRHNGGFAFELVGRDGYLNGLGGSNVFLAADIVNRDANSFESPISLKMQMKVLSLKATPLVSGAENDGSVVGQYFSGFTVSYSDPKGQRQPISMFVQIHHADTRRVKFTYRGCYPHGNYQEIVFSEVAPEDPYFIIEAEAGDPLMEHTFNLNKYLCRALVGAFSCRDSNGSTYSRDFREYASDLSHWKINSFYTGLETQAALEAVGGGPGSPRGFTEMKVQIAGLSMSRDNTKIYSDCDGVLGDSLKPAPKPTPTPTPTPTPAPAPVCSNGEFLNQQGQTVEFKCNCGVPSGAGWSPQGNDCYHRLVPDKYFCTAEKTKTYYRCGGINPGSPWVGVGGGCFHLGSKDGC